MRYGRLLYGSTEAVRGGPRRGALSRGVLTRGAGGGSGGAAPASSAAAPPTSSAAGAPWDLLLLSLGAMVLTYVWRFQELYPILATLQIPTLASVAAIAFYVINQDPRRSLRHLRHPLLWLALALLAFVVVSIPGSLWTGASFRFFSGTYWKTFLLLLLVAAAVRSVQDVRRLVAITVLGATVYCVYVLTRFEIGDHGRLGNLVYYDANDLALVVVCTFPLAVYFATRAQGTAARIAATLVIGLMVMGIVKSGSRGGFLGLIAVGGYLLFGFQALSKQLRVAAVGGAFLLLSFVATDRYWEMMESMLTPQDDYNFTAEDGRIEIWKRGLGYMAQRPFFGVGAGQFGTAEGTLSEHAARQDVGVGFKWSAAHNSFVQIGAELGVFALIAFVAILVVAYRTARHGARAPPGTPGGAADGTRHADRALGHALAGAIVGFVVAGFFLSQAYSIYLYALLGLILGYAKVSRWADAPTGGRAAAPARGPGWRATRHAPVAPR